MCRRGLIAILLIAFVGQQLNALEQNKRYNPNTDFLLHEAGSIQGSTSAPKRDYVAPVRNPSTKKDDFPPLGSTFSTQTTARPLSSPMPNRVTQSSGKRDYVAPPRASPTQAPQRTKNQEDFPSLSSLSTQTTLTSPLPNRVTQPSGKRDYVASNFPSLPSPNTQPGAGKVKDLVNFYDSKSHPQNAPQKVPSYSSILHQGNGNNQGTTSKLQSVTQVPLKVVTNQTPKPLSFSSIVAGSKRPTAISTGATTKPSTTGVVNTQSKPNNNVIQASTPRPNILPSSLANNNNQESNGNGNALTDSELQTLSEELLKRDTNNAAKYVTINYQEKTTSQSTEDKAPLPLLSVSPEAWNIPTIQKFIPLLDNYERDTLVNEYVTPQERNEENAFMDAIMSTSVIRHLMNFLKDKGYVSPDPRQQRDFLKQLWFGLYSRGKGKLSSSGFEHSFVSELKNGQVSGLHNWIYFSREEQANRLNYLGYLKYTQLNDKGAVVKLHFNQLGVDKPVDSLFIGTSPELEMALYTLCFLTRIDDECSLKLAGKDVKIMAYKFRYRSKNYIGSAYPQI